MALVVKTVSTYRWRRNVCISAASSWSKKVYVCFRSQRREI